MATFLAPQPVGLAAGAPGWPGTYHDAHAPGSDNGRRQFEAAVQALEAEAANAGAHAAIDAQARQLYLSQTVAMSTELRELASRGAITRFEAASQAQEARNTIMVMVRRRTTPVGRARAEAIKREGRTFNTLIAEKAIKLFGPNANFNTLTTAQQNSVYAEIVASAGRPDAAVTARVQRLSRAGRGLIVLSLAMSVYEVAVAKDKVLATEREVAVTGGGIVGGMAGGALAGLACGPASPVCVTLGAFMGGALAAFGVASFF